MLEQRHVGLVVGDGPHLRSHALRRVDVVVVPVHDHLADRMVDGNVPLLPDGSLILEHDVVDARQRVRPLEEHVAGRVVDDHDLQEVGRVVLLRHHRHRAAHKVGTAVGRHDDGDTRLPRRGGHRGRGHQRGERQQHHQQQHATIEDDDGKWIYDSNEEFALPLSHQRDRGGVALVT